LRITRAVCCGSPHQAGHPRPAKRSNRQWRGASLRSAPPQSYPPTGSQIPEPPGSLRFPSSGRSSPYQPPRGPETTPAFHPSRPASSLLPSARSSSAKRAQESLAEPQRVPKSACPCCPLLLCASARGIFRQSICCRVLRPPLGLELLKVLLQLLLAI